MADDQETIDSSNVIKGPFPEQTLQGGGGGGMYGDMERRVTALEKQFDRIDNKLDALIKDVSELKGRVASLPSSWQMIGIFIGMLALVMAGATGLIAVLRYLPLINGVSTP